MNDRTHIAVLLEEAMDYYRAEELDKANVIYDRILAHDNNNYEALEWSGEIAIQQDDYVRAADHLGRAKGADPQEFKDFANLGLAYYELDQPVDAVENLQAAIEHDAEDLVAHSNLGKALYELHNAGHIEEAIKIARQWVDEFPHIPDARHMGPAVAGMPAPDRADEAFVTETFDDFSEDFDKKLAELNYRAPEFIGALVAKVLGAAKGDLYVLDAGCGTGLAGPYLRPYAKELTGVDLSQKMLDKAEIRGGYDALLKAELVDFLESHHGSYDLCVAADVFCYFGELESVFKATATSLKAGGYFSFSLEVNDAQDAGYQLHASGRYAHGESYIKDCLIKSGFAFVEINSETLRTEYAKPVHGVVVIVQKL